MSNELLQGPFEPTPFDTTLEEVGKLVKEALNAPDAEYGWTKIEHTYEGVESWAKQIDGIPSPFLKSKTVFPLNVDVTRRLLAHLQFRSLWDEKFDQADVVKVYNSSVLHCRTQFKAPWPVSPRDFSVVVRTQLIDDGNGYFVVSKSVESEDCPEKEGVVRGHVHQFGYSIVPNATNPDHSDVTYCMCTDPRGSIPNFLLKNLTMSVTEMLSGAQKLVSTQPDKPKEISDSFVQLYEQEPVA